MRGTQTRPPPRLTPEGERARRRLSSAKPFIEFLKGERDHRGDLFFGNAGEEVDEKVKAYRERYLLDSKGAPALRAPRHRPGEEWLEKYVRDFVRIFQEKGQSLRRTRKAI